jgi:apolipoprotein N-acyltransferase
MHETFDRTEKLKASSDRAFGRLMAAVFLLIGLIPLLHAPHEPRWWAVVIAAAFGICAEWWTAPLAPLSRQWLKLGLLLHKIVTPIVLGLLFYLTVLPVGLLMRAFGKDPLRLRRDAAARSYWIVRDPPGPAGDSMKQQF